MKKLSLPAIAAIGTLAAMTSSAYAATVTSPNVTVQAALTKVCTIGTFSNSGVLDFGTYTALTGSALTPVANVTTTISCTRGLTGVQANFDSSGVAKTDAGAATNASGAGVVAGLTYTITATQGAVGAGTAADATQTGTAATYAYTISGGIAAGQAGDITAPTSQTRTLTITY